MIAVIGGALAGLFHRLAISPFVGKQTYQAQSVGTPAAGVILSRVPFTLAYRRKLRHVIADDVTRRQVEHIVESSYDKVFFFYGVVVVVTILSGIGGLKKT